MAGIIAGRQCRSNALMRLGRGLLKTANLIIPRSIEMINIFYSNRGDRLAEAAFNNLLNQLPYFHQLEILKFIKWEDQQRSLFGKMLLKTGLQKLRHNSVSLHDLRYNQFSRPYFEHSLDFNISHSGDFVLCAFSQIHKVGIDVEQIKEIPLVGFENYFSPDEWATVIEAKDRMRQFYSLWTKKESFIKAIGTGLNTPLNEVLITGNKISWAGKDWFLHEIHLSAGYVAHLSTETSAPEIAAHRIDFL